MDCRRFRQQHAAFVDDTLSGVAMVAMRAHVVACPRCAAHDTRLRRALMLARNAERLEPTPEFRSRLADRLARERSVPPSALGRAGWRRPLVGVSALGILVVIGAVTAAARFGAPVEAITLAPVVVQPPTVPAEPVAAPAMLASVTSGLPVYSAVLMARRATEQFADTHVRTVSFQATR